MYAEADYIAISALQHYAFCKRQCALIHIEQLWKENYLTMAGRLLHEKVHSGKPEKRESKKTVFGLAISSARLGISGKTDTVEYLPDGSVRIVEMKRGKPREDDADKVQLCAQALCLEEMPGRRLEERDLFYGKKRRRLTVVFTETLRARVAEIAGELHAFIEAGVTPRPVVTEKCNACSLADLCLPEIFVGNRNVDRYMKRMLEFSEKEDADCHETHP